MHQRIQRAAVGCTALGVTRCAIVVEIGRARRLSLTDLAGRLGLEKSWVGRAVDRAVAAGLVRRQVNPADRRGVLLSLTVSGRAHRRALDRLLDAEADRVLGRVPDRALAGLATALRLLEAAYRTASRRADGGDAGGG
jgi:DNA-binding MarR family transcriptional regulator